MLKPGYGIQGQNYVVLLPWSGMPAGFFTPGILYYVYVLGYSCSRYISSVMVSKSELKSSVPRLLPGRGEYEFAFQF